MFTWTHIGERRFDWRAFRLQNKILLLLFFSFNHQNVNSKCNNDAQMWEAFVWICTFEKKQKTKQAKPSNGSISRPAAESWRVVGVKLTKHSLFSPLPHGSAMQHCVPTQTSPRWRFWQINPVLFLLLILLLFFFFSKREIHTSFQTWDMHFCSNIYPVSTLKVKICENKKKNEKKKKKRGLKRIGVRRCKWTLYKVKERERAGEMMGER